jgi:hypothetical protein
MYTFLPHAIQAYRRRPNKDAHAQSQLHLALP